MEKSQSSFAVALQQEHTDLLADLRELEQAGCSAPGEGPAELGVRLATVRTHITNHFRFEEQGGYMASVLKVESHFAPVVNQLLAEHKQMTQALEAIIQETGTVRSLSGIPREKIRVWIDQVRRHEARENQLVDEAFYSGGATGD
jgi:hypothetical protein